MAAAVAQPYNEKSGHRSTTPDSIDQELDWLIEKDEKEKVPISIVWGEALDQGISILLYYKVTLLLLFSVSSDYHRILLGC